MLCKSVIISKSTMLNTMKGRVVYMPLYRENRIS